MHHTFNNLNHSVRLALHERGVEAQVQHMSRKEIITHFLEYNGIIGFTDFIVDAIDSVDLALKEPPHGRG